MSITNRTSRSFKDPISRRSSANIEHEIGAAVVATFRPLICPRLIPKSILQANESIAMINRYGDIAHPCVNPRVGFMKPSPDPLNRIVNLADVTHASTHLQNLGGKP